MPGAAIELQLAVSSGGERIQPIQQWRNGGRTPTPAGFQASSLGFVLMEAKHNPSLRQGPSDFA